MKAEKQSQQRGTENHPWATIAVGLAGTLPMK
jgi:hypothetical protein